MEEGCLDKISKNGFFWDYLHALYLFSPKVKRPIEEYLMRKEILYEEREERLSLCEVCKPTTVTFKTNNMKIGFSDKMYFYSVYTIDLIRIPELLEKAYHAIEQNGLQKTGLAELITVANAEKILLSVNTTFQKQVMGCGSCATEKGNMEKFLQSFLQRCIAGNSLYLIVSPEHIKVEKKKSKLYYTPHQYDDFAKKAEK